MDRGFRVSLTSLSERARMRRLLSCVATVATALTGLTAEEPKQSELSRILSSAEQRPRITERTLGKVLLAADRDYNRMQQSGPASIALLQTLLDLADYHQSA